MPMAPVHRIADRHASAVKGNVVIDATKSMWFACAIISTAGAFFVFSWQAFAVFTVMTYVTLLLGHSVGMHRMLIHRSFRAPRKVAYPLVWLGTMVGMGGPSKIIAIHDLRDWAQRQPYCHAYFSHRRGFIRDLSWQLFYRFDFNAPPDVLIEKEIACDPFYSHLDRWWAVHQAFLAAGLFVWGGLPFVLWGFGVRVVLSVCGHWCVTYLCHNPGPGRWRVEKAGVQASNLRGAMVGLLTHGECWHNNHHAFPESAKIGLDPGQPDPSWAVISWLESKGLVTNVGLPRNNVDQDDLEELSANVIDKPAINSMQSFAIDS